MLTVSRISPKSIKVIAYEGLLYQTNDSE